MNCNDCKNINYTEQEQHYRGVETIPEHHCEYYNTRVYHLNHHNGCDYYIYPCSQCMKDKYKHFKKRTVVMNVNEVLDGIEMRTLDDCATILKEKYDINIQNEDGEYKTTLEILEEIESKEYK